MTPCPPEVRPVWASDWESGVGDWRPWLEEDIVYGFMGLRFWVEGGGFLSG